MNVWSSAYALVFGGFVLLWLGISAYVIVTRTLFDLADLSFHTGRRVLERRLKRLGSPEAALARLPRRTLAGIAADASTDLVIARIAAARLLDDRSDRVLRHARCHRNDAQKWRRIAALRILSIAEWHISMALLRDALEDADPDVAGAAVSILGMGGKRGHAEILVDALQRNVVARSRIAAQLEAFQAPIADLLMPLLDDVDPAVRQWGATLLSRYDEPAVEVELAALALDLDPQVRAAALKGLARSGSGLAIPAALTALEDPVWFVRVHAARALGRLGHPELATHVMSSLSDTHWWVRSAAKDALSAMGGDAGPELMRALHDDDEFVRNGAAEVLQNTGALDELVSRVAKDPADELSARAVHIVFTAGGTALADAAIQRSDLPLDRARELRALAEPRAS